METSSYQKKGVFANFLNFNIGHVLIIISIVSTGVTMWNKMENNVETLRLTHERDMKECHALIDHEIKRVETALNNDNKRFELLHASLEKRIALLEEQHKVLFEILNRLSILEQKVGYIQQDVSDIKQENKTLKQNAK